MLLACAIFLLLNPGDEQLGFPFEQVRNDADRLLLVIQKMHVGQIWIRYAIVIVTQYQNRR